MTTAHLVNRLPELETLCFLCFLSKYYEQLENEAHAKVNPLDQNHSAHVIAGRINRCSYHQLKSPDYMNE